MERQHFFRADECSIDDFRAVVEAETTTAQYPHASRVEQNTLVYESGSLRRLLADPQARRRILTELSQAFSHGPGVVLFTGAVDHVVVDRASAAFEEIITEEKQRGTAVGDHFAKAGANDRAWNTLEKLALRSPDVFADYYANDVIALASEAWLGPGYQITSQVNVVNPGGEAQAPHRDYHLGFLTDEAAERYPRHVHLLSPILTLQGAVAHCDMPVESGPTMYLPHSQKYERGYLAWRRAEFKQYFAKHHVQLPLAKGDAVFFNPALFHAAGSNVTTDVRRIANLLQVSSAFGRVMESVDYDAMCNAVYPEILRKQAGGADVDELSRIVAACAYGYPFPTNLDRDQPISGLAPESQADMLRRAIRNGWPPEQVTKELREMAQRRLTR